MRARREYYQTQFEILNSRRLAEDVIKKLDLAKGLMNDTVLDSKGWNWRRWIPFLPPPKPQTEEQRWQFYVNRFQDNVEIQGAATSAAGGTRSLEAVADSPVDQLTLHQLKFLELARALATEPTLLLLDEVLAGLNPTEIEQSIEMIRKIHERGITLVIVEHLLRVVTSLSDRIVVLDQGSVIAAGDPTEVLADPAVVAAYLGGRAPDA